MMSIVNAEQLETSIVNADPLAVTHTPTSETIVATVTVPKKNRKKHVNWLRENDDWLTRMENDDDPQSDTLWCRFCKTPVKRKKYNAEKHAMCSRHKKNAGIADDPKNQLSAFLFQCNEANATEFVVENDDMEIMKTDSVSEIGITQAQQIQPKKVNTPTNKIDLNHFAVGLMNQKLQESDGKFYNFSKFIETELAQMPGDMSTYAMKLISDVLFEGKLGHLRYHSKIVHSEMQDHQSMQNHQQQQHHHELITMTAPQIVLSESGVAHHIKQCPSN